MAKLQGAKFFTNLNLRWGYNNVRVKEGDEWKTAFRTKFGLFETLVMPFSLTNAPACFHHFMNDLLRDLLEAGVLVYLHDILIYAATLEVLIKLTKEVPCCLKEANLFCKASKCSFHVTTVEYLGINITPEGMSLDQAKVKDIMNWPIPTSVKKLQSFLGFANFLC